MPDDTNTTPAPTPETKAPQDAPGAPQTAPGTPDPTSDKGDSEILRETIAKLQSALELSNKTANEQIAAQQAQLVAMQTEAVNERRTSALNRLGLPAEYHAVAPAGDPKDPAVAESLEKWAVAHPLLLQSRAPQGPQVDLEKLAKGLPSGGKGLTSMSNMQANWEAMRGGR